MNDRLLKDNQKEVTINGRIFIKTTPAEGFELVKVGTNEHYSEAIDLPTSNFEYVEVEIPVIEIEEVLDEQQPNDIGE